MIPRNRLPLSTKLWMFSCEVQQCVLYVIFLPNSIMENEGTGEEMPEPRSADSVRVAVRVRPFSQVSHAIALLTIAA